MLRETDGRTISKPNVENPNRTDTRRGRERDLGGRDEVGDDGDRFEDDENVRGGNVTSGSRSGTSL